MVLLTIPALIAVALCGIWGGLFVWFQMPGGTLAAGLAAAIWGVATCAALVTVARGGWLWLPVYAAGFLLLAGWYAAIRPRADRDWAPEVSRPLTGRIDGDTVTIPDVRTFRWFSATEADPSWETRRYALSDLVTLDLVNSYWTGPLIAHTLLSFGFADGTYLDVSAEIRPERGEAFSSLAGFFKHYELVFVGADERDIVRVRTNERHEDVQFYRIRAEPAQVRALFVEVLRQANEVAAKPAFYGTLDRNCTTIMFGAARAVAPGLPFDYRILLSGYLPDYAYDHDLVDTRLSLAELRARSHVSARAIAAGEAADFSARIRAGLPDPNR